jgi:transposase InsO family protein
VNRGRLEITVGADVWFEGELWHVQRIDIHGVELTNQRSAVRVSIAKLCSSSSPVAEPGPPDTDEELVAVVLGSLNASERQALEERANHVREVLAESRERGGKTATETYEKKAAELGVSVRTIERWVAGYRDAGMAGLADSRLLRRRQRRIDPRWDAMVVRVLDEMVSSSTPTMKVVIDRVGRELEAEYGHGAVALPSMSTAARRLKVLAKGRYAFGSAKSRRSVHERPAGAYGRLLATRPGEFVVLDTTPLDVFAMEPVTLRWLPVELTIAMDLFTRCIVGLQLTPVSTKAIDIANVLFQAVTPQPLGADRGDEVVWPFHGVPHHVLVGTEEPDGVSRQQLGGLPACLPESVVVDNGKQYMSAHVIGACARLGISVQPAIPKKPTDKPTVERFFRTLRESLLQHLPAYKGPDVYSRGKNVEGDAFYYIGELEQIIREWVGIVYHHTKHDGLCIPELPQERFSPAEMFEIGLARSGSLTLPARQDLVYEFLDVAWRTIQHYGVEINGQRYDGDALNGFRNVESPYGGTHAGKWPFSVDSHDVRFVYFRHPDTGKWARLEWEHARSLGGPFSQEAADYAKKVSIRANRHVDPGQAVQDLLSQWSRDEVVTRRERSLARRLSGQRHQQLCANEDGAASSEGQREVASLPTVVELLARQPKQSGLHVVDDLDVFERYYDDHPDEDAFEVFDE